MIVSRCARHSVWLAVAAVLSLGACTTQTVNTEPPIQLSEVKFRPGFVQGYLRASELPNSALVLPPPPAVGTVAAARDEAAHRALVALLPTSRGALAKADANLYFPKAADAFACVLGMPIDEVHSPHLLMRRTLADAAVSIGKAKLEYQRPRPFVALGESICTPDKAERLRGDGAYPSAASAIGWTWALVLMQVAPDKANALLQRGRSYGQSTGICGVNWLSDIEAGRTMGAVTVARLQSSEVFLEQVRLARQEFAAAKARGVAEPEFCQVQREAESLSVHLLP